MSCSVILPSTIGHLFYFLIFIWQQTLQLPPHSILELAFMLASIPQLMWEFKLCERLFSKYRKAVLMIQGLVLFFWVSFWNFCIWISNHKEMQFKTPVCFWFTNIALKFLEKIQNITFQTDIYSTYFQVMLLLLGILFTYVQPKASA